MKQSKKLETAENISNSKFAEIISKLEGYKPIYIHGLKTQQAVAAAAVKVEKSITEAYNKTFLSLQQR